MISSKNRITRRTLLRGAGSVAIALPFLEAMLPPGRSHAKAVMAPLRLLVFYTPGGTLLDKWRPTGTETAYVLDDMLSPLNPYKDRLLFVDGLDLSITQKGVGHPHSRGMAGVLTGQKLLPGDFETGAGGASFADGVSVDQVIAGRVSAGLKFKSLEYSSAWSISGRSSGEVSFAANQLTMAGSKQPIPPEVNPLAAFNRIFGDFPAGSADPVAVAAATARTRSILDAVQDQFKRLNAQLGAADRNTLSAHLDMIRDMENRLSSTGTGPGSFGCVVPRVPVATDWADIPSKGKLMTDMLVTSLACDLTRVATMQWADSEAKFPLDFAPLMLPNHHHYYQHDATPMSEDRLFVIYKWYASMFAYLLAKLDSVQEGDGTLLDNTLVLAITEIQHPSDHLQKNMPFILGGKAQGKIRSGRWLQVPSQPHNNLLVSLLNIFGGDEKTFGDPDFNTGALAGLT
ncbi:MAG: DUF1552 domain-containing protein [Myxococcales bacterium]